jgi:hypothetical protein
MKQNMGVPGRLGHVELHHDGSMALAIGFSTWLRGKDDGAVHRVPVAAVDSLLVEAVALAATHVRSLGGAGTTQVRSATPTTAASG